MKKKEDGFKNIQARYRAKNKANGFCIYCKQPRADGSRTLCKRHLDICRVYQARVREGFRKYRDSMVNLDKDREVRGAK